MKKTIFAISSFFLGTFALSSSLFAGGLIFADDGRVGYEENPKQWWSDYVVHDIRRPIPERVTVDPAKLDYAAAPQRLCCGWVYYTGFGSTWSRDTNASHH